MIQLSPESLDKILEHDRWKTELILDHELRIEELRNNLLKGGGSEAYVLSEEDRAFNSLTSGSECGDSQMFRLSKTKVKNGITTLCTYHYTEFYLSVVSDERWESLADPDKNKLKIKGLFTAIVYFICCAERVRRWPLSRDKSSLSQVQKELESKCITFNSKSLELIYDKVILFWPVLFNGELEFNDLEIKPIISDSILKTKEPTPKDVKTSPLFVAASAALPTLDLAVLEKYHSMLPFVEAGIKTLTLDFIKNRPPELDYTDEYAEWPNIYINHLHSYKENWKNMLKEILRLTEEDQRLWDEESM